jgi:hypothetical protein
MEQILITPVTISIVAIQLFSIDVRAHKKAYISGAYLDNAGNRLMSFSLEMPSEIYNQWGDDDSYVESWVLNELGLQAK